MKEEKNDCMSCACCEKHGEMRIKVSLCKECFEKVVDKYDKEPKPYDETRVEEANKYWGV